MNTTYRTRAETEAEIARLEPRSSDLSSAARKARRAGAPRSEWLPLERKALEIGDRIGKLKTELHLRRFDDDRKPAGGNGIRRLERSLRQWL